MSKQRLYFEEDDSNGDYRFDTNDGTISKEFQEGTQELDIQWKQFILNLKPITQTATYRKYKFDSFYHSYACTMIKQLNRYGIDGLLNPKSDTEAGKELLRQEGAQNAFSFKDHYEPENQLVDGAYPEEGFDFDFDGPYGIYNWELFFHAPLHIATKLTQNQKFEDAQKWLHYIFNPTETKGNVPERYWKVKPFYKNEEENGVSVILEQMASGDKAFNRQLDQWMKNPFQPHVIARLRTVAYMKTVVIKYLDNLIQWGDNLFRRDTIESLNEATQIYILASQVLGPKPISIEKPQVATATVEDILNVTSNLNKSLVDLESEIGSIDTDQEVDIGQGMNNLNSVLYFCTAPNDKLLKYWDTVADRLFKIRHCMNIEGVTRSLALFEPPIDPALLVKAAASGLDIGTVLNNVSGFTLPHYRFRVLIQKANELCNDVKSLGQSLLSALEKKDAEELSLLRASQEVTLLKAIRQIRKQSIEENKENLASLENANELSEIRRQFYNSREYMNRSEGEQLKKLDLSNNFQSGAGSGQVLAGKLALFPNWNIGINGAFGSPSITTSFGGSFLSQAAMVESQALSVLASREQHLATKAGITGGYDRREDDWELQTELAEKEIEQISRQIAGAEIRLAVSERELVNHDMQIQQSSEAEAFMRNKYTNRDLYNWMITQVSGMYFQSYQLAYDVARMAEQAYGHELAQENTSFVQFGHWDSLKRGLLAGEKLQADLRRMEIAYLEQNKREYELTKHIALSMLSPSQLVNLRENGACDIQIPEVLFDLDHPGQYMRRIKSVRLTIPSVSGPYTNINAKLTLLSNRIRKNTEDPSSYAYVANDPRFRYNVAGVQSIATSSGQNDSGTFELNFQDERYLPFEGAGSIGSWRLELSSDFRQFDYDTISDVIITMNYTAREGGEVFKAAVNESIEVGLNKFADILVASGKGLQRTFSLKTHFPNELYNLLQPTTTPDEQRTSLSVKQEHFPYYLKDKTLSFSTNVLPKNISVMVKFKNEATLVPGDLTSLGLSLEYGSTPQVLGPDPILSALDPFPLRFQEFAISSGSPIETWGMVITGTNLSTLLNSTEVEDIYLIMNYTVSNP